MTLFTPFLFAWISAKVGHSHFYKGKRRIHTMSGSKISEPRSHKHGRVLLVGADQSGRDSISTLLSTWGWTCTVVSAHEDVLHAIERVSFDAVLLDLSCS